MNARLNFFVVLSYTLLAGLLIPSWAQSQGASDRYLVKTGDNTMRVAVVNRTPALLSGLKLRFAQDQPQWFKGQGEESFDLGTPNSSGQARPVMLEFPFRITASGALNEPTTLELVSQGDVLGSVSVMLGMENSPGGISGSVKPSEGSLKEGVLSEAPKGRAMEPLFIPTDYALGQNYPNPFNPTTTIQYDLPQAAWVVLKVYDVLGRDLRTLVEGVNPAGRHSISWDGKDADGQLLPSGVYIYRMAAASFIQTRKMLLVR